MPPEPDRPRGGGSSTKSRSARRADGRAHREQVPLEALGELPSEEDRADPVAILTGQDRSRLRELVPIRHGRMSATPFTFFRGAAAVMAADLAATPRTDLRTQLCGDAHLSNFGTFHGPDRRLLFDLNDFDETLPGPFEWDVKRLAASITVAARNNELPSKKIARATRAAARGYRETIANATELSPLDLHYFRLEMDELVTQADAGDKRRRRTDKALKKATRKNHMRAFDKLTAVVDGRRVIVADPPLITRSDDVLEGEEFVRLTDFFGDYLTTLPRHRKLLLDRYRIVDVAHKVVGVGSVGTRCLVVLLVSGDDEPLVLQFKEANASVLEAHVGSSEFEQAGERVVRGQRLMQATGDVLLGWSQYRSDDGRSHDFYFRQLWDGKGSADVDEMGPNRLARYAWHCGGALALAHARSADPAVIAGYVGDDETFEHVLADFADGYAALNERDHAAHRAAIAEGRVEAVRDI